MKQNKYLTHQSTFTMLEVNESPKQVKISTAVLQYWTCVSQYELAFALAPSNLDVTQCHRQLWELF